MCTCAYVHAFAYIVIVYMCLCINVVQYVLSPVRFCLVTCLSVVSPVCLVTCLYVLSPVYLSCHLSICLVTCLSVLSPVYMSCHLSICLVTCLSVLSPVYLSCHLFICLVICPVHMCTCMMLCVCHLFGFVLKTLHFPNAGCFLGVVLVLLVYELWRLCHVIIDVLRWLKDCCTKRSKVVPSITENSSN